MGQNPLDRERLVSGALAAQSRDDVSRDRRRGHRALGHRGQGGRAADPPTPRVVSGQRARLRELRRAALEGGVRGRGRQVQGRGLERIQDPSADRSQGRHRSLRGGAPRGGRPLHGDARLDVGVRLSRGAQSRAGGRSGSAFTGTKIRWPTTTSTATSSSSRSSRFRFWRPNTRRAASPRSRRGSPLRRRTTCAATSR